MNNSNEFDAIVSDLANLSSVSTLSAQVQSLENCSFDEVVSLKRTVENELTRLFDLLHDEYKSDFSSPLVDNDGFPRSDIDLLQVRLLRRNINILRNDLKTIIEHFSKLISQQFQKQTQNDSQQSSFPSKILEYTIPFAILLEVAPTSPSALAGIISGDRLVKFGSIHAGNHQRLEAIRSLVNRYIGKEIALRIQREDGTFHELILTPSMWAGPGLLGCKLSEI